MIEPDTYCRDIEAYLCRKNEGHLIRIVGPAFELVSGWAKSGVPLKVACAGIDRYVERYYRKGPRRRPVRVEFCDADVQDAFDDWRRSVGVRVAEAADSSEAGDDAGVPAQGRARRGPSLAAHIDQVLTRLTLLRSSVAPGLVPADIVERAVRAIDALQVRARGARGDARDGVISELAGIEREVLADLLDALPAADRARLHAEAEQQLSPFKARMPADAFSQARDAALRRLVAERTGLPRLGYGI